MDIIKIGCCGWSEAHQKYYKDFGTLEVQETFYNPGKISKYQKWKKEAPDNFEFIVKSWQLITHPPSSPTYRKLKIKIPKRDEKNYGFFRTTPQVLEAWKSIEEVAKALQAKFILFQCPSSFKPTKENKENIKKFIKKIKNKNYTLLWEPREWEEKDAKEVCKETGLVHVVDPFKIKPVEGPINYFRLHGKPGYNLRYKYTDSDLNQLMKFCDKKTNYVMFNNISMAQDAKRFQKLAVKRTKFYSIK